MIPISHVRSVSQRQLSLSDLGHSKELVHPFRAVLIWEEIKIWSKYRLLNPNAETSYPIPVRISTTARESEKRPDIFAKGRWSLVQDQRLAPNSSIRPMTALHCPKIINKTWIACRRHVWLQLTFYTKTCWNIWFEWLNITRCIFCCIKFLHLCAFRHLWLGISHVSESHPGAKPARQQERYST